MSVAPNWFEIDPTSELPLEVLRSIVRVQMEIAAVGLEPTALMQRIAESSQHLIPQAQGAVVELLEGDGMVYRAATGSVAPFVGLRLKAESSLSGLCVARDEILVSDDTQNDPRVDRDACDRIGVRTILVVPLRYRSKTVGVLKVVASSPNAFKALDRQILSVLSLSLSAALANSEEFAASEDQFRSLADAMPNLAWIAHADGFMHWFNRGWYEFTGSTPKEMEGWGWQSVPDPEELPKVLQSWRYSIATGQDFEMTFPLKGADGSFRRFLTRGHPVRDSRGKVLRWFGTSTDIEDEIKRKEDLQAAVRARDEFLSIASHELKTPLTSLKLQTQLFERNIARGTVDALNPEQLKKLTEQTGKQVGRLVRLVDDMMDISRIRSGKLTIETEPMDLCELVRESVERMKSQFVQAGCPLPEIHLCPSAKGIWDRLRLEQVINNLLTNAIRYGNKKPVEIRVERHRGLIRLSVKDHGIGIEKEALDRIFGRFERAIDASEVSGLGLGLFITKQIVQVHGGKIWVESEIGEGSTFAVDLPDPLAV